MLQEHERSGIREEVLAEARRQLKANLSILAMLKGNTPLADIAKLRDEWVTPLEELVRKMEGEASRITNEGSPRSRA